MADKGEVVTVFLVKWIDWLRWWKTQAWKNERVDTEKKENIYFNNIIRELKVDDRLGFREMFRMDAQNFQFVLNEKSHLILPGEMSNLGGNRP